MPELSSTALACGICTVSDPYIALIVGLGTRLGGIKLSLVPRLSPRFSYCKRQKLCRGLGTRLDQSSYFPSGVLEPSFLCREALRFDSGVICPGDVAWRTVDIRI